MKTLNRDKSKELFFRFKELSNMIQLMGGVVQNPDFVNEENAEEIYKNFYNDFKICHFGFNEIGTEVYELYKELIE